ncbi:MAG: S41 family peptidase [Longimicrobiales bacterium]
MRFACWLVITIAFVAGANAQTPQVVSFDSAWALVRNTHFDTTFNGLDWTRVRTELRPKAEAARSNEELRGVLLDMLGRLKQSHFTIIPQDAADAGESAGGSGDLGMDVRWVENALVVTTVEPGGPAGSAGVRPGWTLLRIDRLTTDSLVARIRRNPSYQKLHSIVPRGAVNRLNGPVGSSVELEFLDARNERVIVKPVRRTEPGNPVKFGNMPTFYTRFADRRVAHENTQVGIISFNVWMLPVVARIDSAMDRQRDAQGLIIDLRGNPGGVGLMATGVAGHLVDSARSLGVMTNRTNKLQFRINPRRVNTAGERVLPFGGPVAILTDELSASTSEIFAGGLQTFGRVRVFGASTMGAVLPASLDRLPNGDVLYHAIADFVTPDGTVLEGRGVIPDEPVDLKRADLLAGRDVVLDAALRWIAAQARTQRRTTIRENIR